MAADFVIVFIVLFLVCAEKVQLCNSIISSSCFPLYSAFYLISFLCSAPAAAAAAPAAASAAAVRAAAQREYADMYADEGGRWAAGVIYELRAPACRLQVCSDYNNFSS